MALQVLIVGGGQVGAALAALLLDGRHQVTVLEARPDVVAQLQHELPGAAVVAGSGADPAALEAAGVRQAQVVAAVTGADDTNLAVAGLARFEYGVPRILARLNSHHNAWMFVPAMGVDVALNQAEVMAHLIAEEMSLGDMLTLLKLRKGQYALVEERVAPTAPAAGRRLGELALPAECALAAVIREGQLLIPRAELRLRAGDEVLAVVHAEHLAELAALLSSR